MYYYFFSTEFQLFVQGNTPFSVWTNIYIFTEIKRVFFLYIHIMFISFLLER